MGLRTGTLPRAAGLTTFIPSRRRSGRHRAEVFDGSGTYPPDHGTTRRENAKERVGYHNLRRQHEPPTPFPGVGIRRRGALSGPLQRDSEPPHLGDERRPRHSKSGGSSIPPADDALGLTKSRDDVRSIRLQECVRARHWG